MYILDTIITYMEKGELKTDLISASELDWYLKNTTVYKTSPSSTIITLP